MFKFLKLLISIFISVFLVACGGGGDNTNPSDIRVTCQGSACAAGAVSSYINKSAQVWTYQNTSNEPVTIDLNFSNLAAGQELSYVFGNGYSSAVNALPAAGQALAQDGSLGKTISSTSTQPELSAQDPLSESQDIWRLQGGKKEADLWTRCQSGKATSWVGGRSTAPSAAGTASASSALERVWTDTESDDAKEYTTTRRSACLAGTGRKVVTWADEDSADKLDKKTIAAFEKTMCGSAGAVSRMSRLIGDVWSPVSNGFLIKETSSAMLDINIVVLSVDDKTAWGGYFYAGNSYLKSSLPSSNEALVFFVNANVLAKNLPYTLSLLIHELTHMVYWHERSVLNNAPKHDTWLNEMVAEMSEDILSPALVRNLEGDGPYQPSLSNRLPAYLNTGGGFSLLEWAEIEKASPYYSMASSFGAYLSRQYGLGIYKGIMKDCFKITDGWTCLDTVIKKNGGQGVYEAFNQFGLTVFGLSNASAPSSRFSFPTKVDEGYTLAGLDLSALKKYRPPRSAQVKTWATGTHTYFFETSLLDIFTFTRRGITIPAQSQLSVMIR
jgi:hypothetical protein